jgi:hypothetical protein
MTIQEAINKAIEGGYPEQRIEDLALHVQAEYFLETSFWEALVREYIQLSRDVPRKIRQPMWLYYWHRFNSHLVAGNTPESFLPRSEPHPLSHLPSIPPLQCSPLQQESTTRVYEIFRPAYI